MMKILKKQLISTIKNLIHYDAFTFVYFQPTEQKFIITKTENKTSLKYVGENLEVDIRRNLSR